MDSYKSLMKAMALFARIIHRNTSCNGQNILYLLIVNCFILVSITEPECKQSKKNTDPLKPIHGHTRSSWTQVQNLQFKRCQCTSWEAEPGEIQKRPLQNISYLHQSTILREGISTTRLLFSHNEINDIIKGYIFITYCLMHRN